MIRAIAQQAAARAVALHGRRACSRAHNNDPALLPALSSCAWTAAPSAPSCLSASILRRRFSSSPASPPPPSPPPPPPPASSPSPLGSGMRGVIVPPSSFTPTPFVPDPYLDIPRAKKERPQRRADDNLEPIILFVTMLLSMFLGSQIVHAIYQPDVRLPDLGHKVIDEQTGAVVIAPPEREMQPLPPKRANPNRQRFVVSTQNAEGTETAAPAANNQQ